MDEAVHLSMFDESINASEGGEDNHTSRMTIASASDFLSVVPPHPQGIKPSGQVYLAEKDIKTATGFFSILPDELIAQILDNLEIPSLLQVGLTCKALWAFSRLDESLWRTRFINCPASSDDWHGDWYSTVLGRPVNVPRRMIDCTGLYSDLLYRPFMCSHIRISPYHDEIPSQRRIPKIGSLTAAEFESTMYAKPFIAKQMVNDWPIMKFWTWGDFRVKYSKVNFNCEGVSWPYGTYESYMFNNSDESPLYLFDHTFVEKMNLRVGKNPLSPYHYWVPKCFGEDYFEVLGKQRPDHRWLIVGPERSGSTFHKDPNGTSAWNAVVRGSKYWIMFPKAPPGVFTSEDQSEVTSPLSIAEWLLGFHAEARNTEGCMEGICEEGEILHVPSGWYHLVVNLKPSIAITQNFVPRAYLADALGFLRYKPDQVSGFNRNVIDPYRTLLLRLREQHPEALDRALKEMDRRYAPKKRKWEDLVKGDSELSHPNKKADLEDQIRRWNDSEPSPKKGEELRKCCFSFCFGGDEGSDEEVP